MNGILGEFVIFPRLNPGAFKSIIWHSPSPANAKAYVSQLYFITLAVITPGAPGALPHVSMEDERYRGRARLHNQSYSLEISNLMLADVGMYSWETASADSNIFCSYDLHIHKRLSELEIRIQSVMAGNGTCNVIFTCSAGEENETIKYIWTRPVGAPVFSIEESLLVQHRLGDKDSPVTCTAMNPVSNSSASASPKAACEGDARSIPPPRAHAAQTRPSLCLYS
ncbi:SLAM family member 9-like [Dermochelys coriacea]|uniref:SLAM family member 9-like n=1 Tax=Dermochelys coriacea TaxID=27794 RepID=UPI001CA8F3DB|nr:SLAM family member 9-like [Dermochelys coriacea]